MHRFFCRPQNIASEEINILDRDELHHLRDVLRLKNQDKVVVIDGKGGEFLCQISHLGKRSVKLDIIERHVYKKENFLPSLTVASALPKRLKADFIVEKLTEIGADKIIFLKTEHTEVNFKDYAKKTGRLEKVAESALKQSGNVFVPEICFLSFDNLLKLKLDNEFDIAVIANLADSDACNIKDALEEKSARNILIAIGPEGDFSRREISLAKQAGFISVSLGNTVLKVDTAVIVAAGFIKLSAFAENHGLARRCSPLAKSRLRRKCEENVV